MDRVFSTFTFQIHRGLSEDINCGARQLAGEGKGKRSDIPMITLIAT